MGKIAGQLAFVAVSLALPASIMVLALEERLVPAINPFRLVATVAGIGLPYLALCAFLFLLLQSSQYLAGFLATVLPAWLGVLLAKAVSMYFTVSMYYLMGYALYQNHAALGVDVQVDTLAARQALDKGAKAAPADVLGPMTQSLVAEGKLEEAAGRIESRLRGQWDDNKLHDRYHKLLLLDGKPEPIARHVNEYVPKLVREKRLARAIDVYETARKKVPDLAIQDGTLILPLAAQAYELKHDQTALDLVRAFDKRFPKSDDIPGVYLLAARILVERKNDYATAQTILRHLAAKYPQHPLAAEAKRLGDTAAKLAAGSRPA
jgi:hypothetical protein